MARKAKARSKKAWVAFVQSPLEGLILVGKAASMQGALKLARGQLFKHELGCVGAIRDGRKLPTVVPRKLWNAPGGNWRTRNATRKASALRRGGK